MKVNVLRTGGFAGLVQAWEVRVDEQPNAQEWVSLVNSCPWDDPQMCEPGADRFVYEVSAGQRSATLGEQEVQGPWRDLVQKVREDGVKLKPSRPPAVAAATKPASVTPAPVTSVSETPVSETPASETPASTSSGQVRSGTPTSTDGHSSV